MLQAKLGLFKVVVAKSQVEGLQMHLKRIVDCLFKWQTDPKNHLKAKVKLLLGMLVRKCGFEAVKSVIPEEHTKLLTNIRKEVVKKIEVLTTLERSWESTECAQPRGNKIWFGHGFFQNIFLSHC